MSPGVEIYNDVFHRLDAHPFFNVDEGTHQRVVRLRLRGIGSIHQVKNVRVNRGGTSRPLVEIPTVTGGFLQPAGGDVIIQARHRIRSAVAGVVEFKAAIDFVKIPIRLVRQPGLHKVAVRLVYRFENGAALCVGDAIDVQANDIAMREREVDFVRDVVAHLLLHCGVLIAMAAGPIEHEVGAAQEQIIGGER